MTETLDIPSDQSQEVVIRADDLLELLTGLLKTKGMYAVDARIGAARLLEADLRGIHSHGSRSIWRSLSGAIKRSLCKGSMGGIQAN